MPIIPVLDRQRLEDLWDLLAMWYCRIIEGHCLKKYREKQ